MTPQPHHIRPATPADTAALVACIDAAYARHARRIPDLPAVSDGVADDIACNRVWVAEQLGELVGGLFLLPQDGFLKLANLAVHPAQGSKGNGRALIAFAEAEAMRRGYNEMRLNTHVEMPENIQFYQKLGWIELTRNSNTVTMKKSLRDG